MENSLPKTSIEQVPIPSLDEFNPQNLLKTESLYNEKKKQNYKKNKTIDKLDKLEILPSSHIHRFEKMHSPSSLFNTFSPTHFSPKNLSPLKKKPSRFSSSSSSLSSKKFTILETDKICENRDMTDNLKEFLLKSFKRHFIFGFMDEGILENILSSMKSFSLAAEQTLLSKDETTEYVYIIETGEIVSIDEAKSNKIHHYAKGSIIFDDLFFNNSPSNFKYITIEDTVLWGLPSTQISLIILQITEKKYNENRAFIDPINFFSKLTDLQKDSLAYNMKTLKFTKQTVIIKEDQIGLNFYILKQGLLIVTVKDKFSHYLKPGDCFGESVFLEKNRRYTVICESETAECLSMAKKSVLELFDEDFEKVIYKNLVRKVISNSQKLSRLTSVQIDQFINLIKYQKYSKDEEVILKENEDSCMILLLLDGRISSVNKKIEFSHGHIIGEERIMDPEYRLSSLISIEESLIGECNLYELEKVLGGKIEYLLEKNRFSHENLILFQKGLDASLNTLNKKVNANEIKVLKVLGEGFTGIVLLVDYEEKMYALKIISKGWIIEKELEEYIRNEKEIYNFVEFEFITRMCYTFKDDLSIYFMLEFVKGMELFTVLYNKKRFECDEAKFYMGILILCLQYLHNKGIIHRDIKPENIIIDSTGYIKLCDLGIAKLMLSNTTRTYTLLGTKFYIAPEMIIGKGYSFPIDFWSLGICLYEFVCGDVPFGANEEEPYNIYQSIVLDKLAFPSFVKDKNTKDFIKSLLVKSPEKRLGRTFGEIKGHKFFEGFEWDLLMNKKIKPPFVPEEKELNLKEGELEELMKKTRLLSELLKNPDIVQMKEKTMTVKSEFVGWDDIFPNWE